MATLAERREQRRVTAIALAFISIGGLLVGAIGKHWLVDPDGGSEYIGLHSTEACADGKCESISNFKLIDEIEKDIESVKELNKGRKPQEQLAVPSPPWHGFPVVGAITLVFSIIAAVGMLMAAVSTLKRKRVDAAIMPTTIALLGLVLTIITGCLFLATKPNMVKDMAVGWSFWCFGAGAVAGLFAVFPLNRQIRPIDEELGESSATMSWGASRDDE